MYRLYFHKSPNTYKIAMMLEEIGEKYETQFINVGEGEQFSGWFSRISPNHKVPVLTDCSSNDSEPDIVIFESNAILCFLADRHRALMPACRDGRADVLQWLFWQAAGQGPTFGQCVHFKMFAPENPYAIWRFDREARRLIQVLEERLDGRQFVCGNEYSIADIACYPWLSRSGRTAIGIPDLDEYPNVQRWSSAIEARPTTIAAFARLDADEDARPNLVEFCKNQFGHDDVQARQAAIRARAGLENIGVRFSDIGSDDKI